MYTVVDCKCVHNVYSETLLNPAKLIKLSYNAGPGTYVGKYINEALKLDVEIKNPVHFSDS